MQKTVRPAPGKLSRLVGIDHIIRRGDNIGGMLGRRAQPGKGTYQGHEDSLDFSCSVTGAGTWRPEVIVSGPATQGLQAFEQRGMAVE